MGMWSQLNLTLHNYGIVNDIIDASCKLKTRWTLVEQSWASTKKTREDSVAEGRSCTPAHYASHHDTWFVSSTSSFPLDSWCLQNTVLSLSRKVQLSPHQDRKSTTILCYHLPHLITLYHIHSHLYRRVYSHLVIWSTFSSQWGLTLMCSNPES